MQMRKIVVIINDVFIWKETEADGVDVSVETVEGWVGVDELITCCQICE